MARIVITGIGIYSCIGIGVDEVDTSLRNGRSGIGLLPERTAMGYRSPLCGLVTRPDATRWLDRKQRAHTSEQGLYAYISALEALGMAGVDDAMKERDEIGIIYGNDSSVGATVTAIDTMRAKHNTTLLGSGSVFRTLNSTVTLNLGPMLGLRGISLSVGGACTSGSHAIGLGYALIRSGMHNCILCGGAQEVNDFSVIGFDGLGVFSMRHQFGSEGRSPGCARNRPAAPSTPTATDWCPEAARPRWCSKASTRPELAEPGYWPRWSDTDARRPAAWRLHRPTARSAP